MKKENEKEQNNQNNELRDKKDTTSKRNSKSRNRDARSSKGTKSVYDQIPFLVEQTAGIMGYYPAGDDINFPDLHRTEATATRIPAIISFDHAPLFGVSERPDDPLTIAILQIDTFVRQGLSGTRYYDPADLGMHLIACGEVLALSAYIKRAFGVAQLFSAVNRFVPTTLLNSMHIYADDILDSRILHLGKFNDIIASLQGLVIPSTFGYYYERMRYYMNYYTESESMRDQLYVINPAGFYMLDWTNKRLKWTPISDYCTDKGGTYAAGPQYDINDLISMLRDMVQAILGNSVESAINTELLRVFGDNRIAIEMLENNTVLAPIVDLTVLEQIKNARIISSEFIDVDSMHIVSDYTGMEVTQGLSCARVTHKLTNEAITIGTAGDRDKFQQALSMAAVRVMQKGTCLITTEGELTPLRRIELTRFCPTFDKVASPNKITITGGTGMLMDPIAWIKPTYGRMFSVYKAKLTQMVPITDRSYGNNISLDNIDSLSNIMWQNAYFKSFRYAPMQYLFYVHGANADYADFFKDSTIVSKNMMDSDDTTMVINANLDNWTVMTDVDLELMHRTALRSLLYPPIPTNKVRK